MAADFAGMTVDQLVTLAAALIGQSGTLWKIVEDLRADGAQDQQQVPGRCYSAIANALHDAADKIGSWPGGSMESSTQPKEI